MTLRCVFVTGATGYMGQALVSELLARGALVAVVERGPQGVRILGVPDIRAFPG